MKASVDTNDVLKSLATHTDSTVVPFGDITNLQKILPYYPTCIFDDHEHNKVGVFPPGFIVFHR